MHDAQCLIHATPRLTACVRLALPSVLVFEGPCSDGPTVSCVHLCLCTHVVYVWIYMYMHIIAYLCIYLPQNGPSHWFPDFCDCNDQVQRSCRITCCYGLSVSPQRISCIRNLVLNAAVLTGGIFGKWLDHEGSALKNGQILWQIDELMVISSVALL